jgi:hypothetical protein
VTRHGDLADITMLSGVSVFTGEGYVEVRALGKVGDLVVELLGQLTPAEMRAHALAYLEAAEAAESDALVFAELTDQPGLDVEHAAAFLVALRARRADEVEQ